MCIFFICIHARIFQAVERDLHLDLSLLDFDFGQTASSVLVLCDNNNNVISCSHTTTEIKVYFSHSTHFGCVGKY